MQPRLLKLSKLAFSKVAAFSGTLATLALASVTLGCAGRNIHRDLKPDTSVMVRNWVITTHGPFNAGDRGFEYSNPVIHENTLIFGNRSIGLISLYPKINQQRWVLPITGGVVSELVVDRDSVYFGGGDGFLYSVNVDTGRVNWRYEVRTPFVSRPTVSGGRLFLTTTDDTIYAFDAGTGKWIWHYRRRSAPSSTILGASAPLVDGNDVIAGLSDGFLVALSVNDGQLKWERKIHTGSKFTDVDAHPVLDNGVIYIPSYDGALYALRRQDGSVIWRYDAGGCKRVVLEGDLIYFPSTDGSIYAMNKNNAKPVWRFELDSGVPTQLITTDQHVIVGSSFQYLYVIDKKTGKGTYRFNVGYGSGFSGSPAFDATNRRVYFLSGAGNLYAFSLRKPPRKIFEHGMTDPYLF